MIIFTYGSHKFYIVIMGKEIQLFIKTIYRFGEPYRMFYKNNST